MRLSCKLNMILQSILSKSVGWRRNIFQNIAFLLIERWSNVLNRHDNECNKSFLGQNEVFSFFLAYKLYFLKPH